MKKGGNGGIYKGNGSRSAPAGPAEELMREVLEELEGREPESLSELQTITNRLVARRNRQPLSSFQGLSAEQMHRLLSFPFDSPQLVRFRPPALSDSSTPVLRLFAPLAAALGERGVKATATGNLPLKLCQKIYRNSPAADKGVAGFLDASIRTEVDFFDLHVVRLTAELAGLIRKYRGRFVLVARCRKMLKEGDVAGIYFRLFQAFVRRFNWGYSDRYPELHIIQQAFLFTLYLLQKFGHSQRSSKFYEDCFLEAFPRVVDEVEEESYSTPETTVRRCFSIRSLNRFAGSFGLADVECASNSLLSSDFSMSKSSLLDEFVTFSVIREL